MSAVICKTTSKSGAIVTKKNIHILYAANEIVVFRITDKRQNILSGANIGTI